MVDAIQRLVDGWPGPGDSAEDLMAQLGFEVQTHDHSRPQDGVYAPFTTPIIRTIGVALTSPTGDVGLNLFVDFVVGSLPQMLSGYQEVRSLLAQAYGDPREEWGSPDQPACCWRRSDGLLMELYGHRAPSANVQIGISHPQPRIGAEP